MVTESIFHNFVVNDAEGAERIAEALSAWTEQYLECTSEEEREQMENELSQALSKNGSIRKVKHYIMLQMNAIKIKEEQYQEDVREAERPRGCNSGSSGSNSSERCFCRNRKLCVIP